MDATRLLDTVVWLFALFLHFHITTTLAHYFFSLLPVVDHIHTLWELVLTGEPLVVMAPTPTLCSATVQHLTSIIYPLSYCPDYRPFYTIHDSDFKDITSRWKFYQIVFNFLLTHLIKVRRDYWRRRFVIVSFMRHCMTLNVTNFLKVTNDRR